MSHYFEGGTMKYLLKILKIPRIDESEDKGVSAKDILVAPSKLLIAGVTSAAGGFFGFMSLRHYWFEADRIITKYLVRQLSPEEMDLATSLKHVAKHSGLSKKHKGDKARVREYHRLLGRVNPHRLRALKGHPWWKMGAGGKAKKERAHRRLHYGHMNDWKEGKANQAAARAAAVWLEKVKRKAKKNAKAGSKMFTIHKTPKYQKHREEENRGTKKRERKHKKKKHHEGKEKEKADVENQRSPDPHKKQKKN